MELDGKITRHFTKKAEHMGSVYDLFRWKTIDGLEFPSHYSQSARDIIAAKYFRKKGTAENGIAEVSMKQVVHRMVSFWVEALYDEVLIDEAQKRIVYDELAYMLLAQIFAPNSPQWFNTGLKLAYNIEGTPQGHYYYDEDLQDVAEAKDAYSRTQGSACFILSVEDSLLGPKSLSDRIVTETLLFKYGSGAGTNWSPIRGRGELLSGGGKSSGLLSFLKVSDRNAGAIKSGGTTRRAAKMNILDLDHPEILDFIRWKSREEDKAEALGRMGYGTGMDGEAYETVSGQNANNSVRIPNSFMEALRETDADWYLHGRVDREEDRSIKAHSIWDEIADAAWRCGDPGLQFDSTINEWHTCPADGRINASNPCSEFMFLDDTACNLASINLIKFYNEQSGEFDTESYLHSIKMAQLVLEATIHWGQFPTKDIARMSYRFRPTGLGFANLGLLFMLMGLPYDSEEARCIGASLTGLMTACSYYISSLMAEKVGPFAAYENNSANMDRVLKNHALAAGCEEVADTFSGLTHKPYVIEHEILSRLGFSELSESLRETWAAALFSGRVYGYRNAQVTVLAPTGTIAFAMDCATTSVEPFFSHIAFKKLVGGGFMEIVSQGIRPALKKLAYTPAQIEDIVNYVLRRDRNTAALLDGKIEGAPHLKAEHYSVFDTAAFCGSGKRLISPEGHVKMLGALTPHISGAISKTVNLPNKAAAEDIKAIYHLAWELGTKAVTVYRDGSKISQPLSSAKDKPAFAPKRLKPSGIRAARVHEAAINGLKLYITTSFYDDGRLGEIYVSSGRQGSLTKGLLDSLSTTVSEMLQYGVPAEDIARMYRGQKYEPSGYVSGHPYIRFADSISDLISKIIDIELGNYEHCQVKPKDAEKKQPSAPAEYIYGEVCPNCKSTKMIQSGTCKVCAACGTTTGCS